MIDHLLSPRLVEALGWTLLHSLWQGAALALLLAVVLIALRSYSARARYTVAVGLLAGVGPGASVTGAAFYRPLDPVGRAVPDPDARPYGVAAGPFSWPPTPDP